MVPLFILKLRLVMENNIMSCNFKNFTNVVTNVITGCRYLETFHLTSKRLLQFWLANGETQVLDLCGVLIKATDVFWFSSLRPHVSGCSTSWEGIKGKVCRCRGSGVTDLLLCWGMVSLLWHRLPPSLLLNWVSELIFYLWTEPSLLFSPSVFMIN